MSKQVEARIAPHSKDSEMMVLGCMLTSINSLNITSDELDDSDFYFTEHKIIFQVLKTAYKKDKPADIHIVAEELKRQEKLNAIGGIGYLTTLAQYAGTSAFIEEYIEQVRNKSLLRKMINAAQIIEKTALEEPDDVTGALEDAENEFKKINQAYGNNISISHPKEMLEHEKLFLNKHRGKEYLGLRVKTIEEFNKNVLGLRGLILLAAAPNVGKTALTVQTGIEVLATEKDACLIYVSLEMSKEQIFRRVLLNLSGLNFKNYVFGSKKLLAQQDFMTEDQNEVFFTKEEIERIEEAQKAILEFGNRLQIIDQSICPHFETKTLINYIESVKTQTGCKRSIVILDYLQVWPIPQNIKFVSDIEADKWRIGEMKKIKDAISQENENPIIVISEARKPSSAEDCWGGDLSDVMGSARGTYTPDIVLLLSALQPAQLKKLWEQMQMPKITYKEDGNELEDSKDPYNVRAFLARHGIAICNLKMPKARDGMKKFDTLLSFYFDKNKFVPVNWLDIRMLAANFQKETSKR